MNRSNRKLFILFYLKLIQFFVCRFLDEDRKEMSELRRQHQELLNVEVRKFAEKLLISNSLKGVSKNFSFNTLYFREDQMSLWVSCMEHYWENMKQSRMILVSWVKGILFGVFVKICPKIVKLLQIWWSSYLSLCCCGPIGTLPGEC